MKPAGSRAIGSGASRRSDPLRCTSAANSRWSRWIFSNRFRLSTCAARGGGGGSRRHAEGAEGAEGAGLHLQLAEGERDHVGGAALVGAQQSDLAEVAAVADLADWILAVAHELSHLHHEGGDGGGGGERGGGAGSGGLGKRGRGAGGVAWTRPLCMKYIWWPTCPCTTTYSWGSTTSVLRASTW